MRKNYFLAALVLILLFIAPNLKAQSDYLVRYHRTFDIDCKGNFTPKIKEIMDKVRAYSITTRSKNERVKEKNLREMTWQIGMNDSAYDQLIVLLSIEGKERVNSRNKYGYSSSRRNRYKPDTMSQYRNYIMAQEEANKWKKKVDELEITDSLYRIYYYKYTNKQRQADNYARNLKRTRQSVLYPNSLTIVFFEDMKKQAKYIRRYDDYYFVPGATAGIIAPRLSAPGLGNYQGIAPEIVMYSRFQTKSRGPSYLKTYFNLGIYTNENNSNRRQFVIGTGIKMSFESRVYRKFMIPYFGLNVGAINDTSIGSSFYFKPNLGVLFYASRKVHVFGEAGYYYAVKHTNQYESSQISVGLNLMLWKD